MAVYVADCPPWRLLWADDSAEALCMVYAVGSDETALAGNRTWEHYILGPSEAEAARGLGAIMTDRMGPAEWMARRRNTPEDHAFIARIAAARQARVI